MQRQEEGLKFERYQIVHQLGSSVTGTSYEADDTRSQRHVTLKLVHPWSAPEDMARRQFFREMQEISRLQHPYLSTILNYGEINRQLYIARNYATYGSLLGEAGRRWFRAPLSYKRIKYYLQEFARVLDFMHQQGKAHGAITFTNILIQRAPHPGNTQFPLLLSDPGNAHFVRRYGRSPITLYPVTAAPEQQKGQLLPHSDQYALAVLLYFWLTGNLPFQGPPEKVAAAKLAEKWTPLRTYTTRATLQQEGVLRKAMSALPRDRYPSITAFAQAASATLQTDQEENEPAFISEQEMLQIIQQTNAKTVSQPGGSGQGRKTEPLPRIETNIPHLVTQGSIAHTEAHTQQQKPMPDPLTPIPPSLESVDTDQSLHSELVVISEKEKNINVLPAEDEPSSTEISEPRAYLQIMHLQYEEIAEIALQKDEITLGKASSSDILLNRDQRTSRHHALIRQENDGYVIYDRRSAYGVRVNGQPLHNDTGQLLRNGDQILIGDYTLTFFAAHNDNDDEI